MHHTKIPEIFFCWNHLPMIWGGCNRSSKISVWKKNDGEDKLFLWMSTISQFSFWLFSRQAVQKNFRGKEIGRKQQQCTNTVSNITVLLRVVYGGISSHIPSGRWVLISPESRENKEDIELLESTGRQRKWMNSSVEMSQKMPVFKRELCLALDLEQVCLCSVETVETKVFSGKSYVQMLFLCFISCFIFWFPLAE